MYTRSYYTDSGERINPPENYDGTAFLDDGKSDGGENVQSSAAPNKNPWESPAPTQEVHACAENESVLSSFSKFPFLSGIFGGSSSLLQSLKIPKIGTEELLIIGAAIFLFLSKDGDRECALILLLLLLIN